MSRVRWLPWVILYLLAVGYALAPAPLPTPPARSHLALATSLLETGSPLIDRYLTQAIPPEPFPSRPEAGVALAYANGHFFSDRPPGLAVVALPFLTAGRVVTGAQSGPLAAQNWALLLPALAAAAAVLATYWVARLLQLPRWLAGLAAATLALAPPFVTAARSFDVQTPAAALLLLATGLVIQTRHRPERAVEAMLFAGLAVGGLVLLEPALAVLVIPFALVAARVAGRPRWRALVLPAGWTLALLVQLGYNTIALGAPWRFTFQSSYYLIWARSLSATYLNSPLPGLGVMFAGPGAAVAATLLTVLALAGARPRLRRQPVAVWLLLSGSAVPLLLAASSRWSGPPLSYSGVAGLALPGALILAAMTAHALFGQSGPFRFLGLALPVAGCLAALAMTITTMAPSGLALPAGPLAGLTAGVLILGALSVLAAPRWHGRRRRLVSSLLVAGVALATMAGLPARFPTPEIFASAEAANTGRGNLLANPAFERTGTAKNPAPGWDVRGPVRSAPGLRGRGLALGPGAASLTGPLVQAWGTRLYRAGISVRGSGTVRLLWAFQDDTHRVVGQGASPPVQIDATWQPLRAEFAAPLDATGLQLTVQQEGAEVAVDEASLEEVGPRVEPLPDGAVAALAFSFDWETAMGGLVHSRGLTTHDLAYATERGLRMRQGTDNLAAMFGEKDIKATFYATGYNLLDGNREHRQFAGNPTYRWASLANWWATDYWQTHGWYSDDPFGTVQ
ncbi:MAG: hypothetical protein IT317_03285, partial [Anaerolineales bacterium]|nr:hypothetical protein [Anaerolineales bacterium]